MSVNGAAAASGQDWTYDQQVTPPPQTGAAGQAAGITSPQEERKGRSLPELIQEAQKQAEAQREALKAPKNAARYGDAPLEAYARLARAKSRAQVNSASGYARRRLAQFKTALRTDGENSAKIKAAISQLQKAVQRGEKKKRELDRERLTEIRRKNAAKGDLREQEQRLRQELLRRKSQRMVRESGYLREADISGRLAAQLTATQMELRQQAQEIAAAAGPFETAVQQYTAAEASAAAVPAGPGFSGQA